MKLAEFRKISPALSADLKAAFAKHGLDMRPFGARIDERLGLVRMTIESFDVKHKAADGTATTPEAEIYKLHCMIFELKPEWLGTTFVQGREEYRLDGMKKGNAQKCIIITRTRDGKGFVSTPDSVRAFILLAQKAA